MRWTSIALAVAATFFIGSGASCAAQEGVPDIAAPPLVPPVPTLAGPTGTVAVAIDPARFDAWRNAFRTKALNAGISAKTFDLALGKVAPNPKILEADQSQPETVRAVWDYLDSAASEKRVANGIQRLKDHAATLEHVQRLYGVAPRFVVAIWAMESNYGANTGGYNVFEALATLAYDGRRSSLAESELLNALRIVERGDATPDEMTGSWAGAMGQTQFMPSAYLKYAVDDDGDGRRDLFESIPDVLASTANYLARWDWRTGETWGYEVKVPKGFDYAVADPTIMLPMKRWRQLGLRTMKGARVPSGVRQAALFLPAGHRGPAFLLLDNFRTFLKYNNSTSYGLGVGLLADRLKGAPPIKTDWPREERTLTMTERREMQTLLGQLGYSVGPADGIFGQQTRLAIKAYQKRIGEPADGFPTVALLERMRTDAAPVAAGNSGAGFAIQPEAGAEPAAPASPPPTSSGGSNR